MSEGHAARPRSQGAFSGIVTGQDLVRKSLSDLMAESITVAVASGIVLVAGLPAARRATSVQPNVALRAESPSM